VDGPKPAQILGFHQIAQLLGRKKSLKINDLHECESAVTGKWSLQPSIGVLVEFSMPVVAGLSGD
jgi:hypothetical protein